MNTFELQVSVRSKSGYEEKIVQRKMIVIHFKLLAMAAYLYMVIPITIFMVTWLRWYVGLPMAFLILFALYRLIQKEYTDDCAVTLSLRTLIIGLLALAVFLWLTGQGGFFFQYSDNFARNALFSDLINFDWPLIYEETGNALSYYLLHWLVPAIVGKIIPNFTIARFALYCWTLLGVILTILLLTVVLNAGTTKRFLLLVFVFCAWSGLDIIGGVISSVFGLINFELNTFRWWTAFGIDGQGYGGLMFRSNCDQLASVYNQTIVPWLTVPLLVSKPRISTFIFLAACVFACSPFAFVAIGVIMGYYFLRALIQNRKKEKVLAVIAEVFSIPNVVALLTIVPVFFLFYTCNMAIKTRSNGFFIAPEKFNIYSLMIIVLFYILQFGIYVLLIRREFRSDGLFHLMAICMCIIPLIQVGGFGDFGWNTSVPFFFLLMMYCLKYLYLHVHIETVKERLQMRISKPIIGIIICLTLSFLSPFTQIAFGFKIAYQEKTFDLMCRGVDTFSDKTINESFYVNYLVPEYEDTPFFHYIAK